MDITTTSNPYFQNFGVTINSQLISQGQSHVCTKFFYFNDFMNVTCFIYLLFFGRNNVKKMWGHFLKHKKVDTKAFSIFSIKKQRPLVYRDELHLEIMNRKVRRIPHTSEAFPPLLQWKQL